MTEDNAHASTVAEQLAQATEEEREIIEERSRQRQVIEFAQAYQEAALESTVDIPEDVEMFDDYHTQEQYDLATAAIEEGLIPDLSSSGPKPLNWYALKAYTKTWASCEGMDEEELRGKIESLQEARERKRKPNYRDGSYNQFLAWNSSCQGAVRWLLGEHSEQQDGEGGA